LKFQISNLKKLKTENTSLRRCLCQVKQGERFCVNDSASSFGGHGVDQGAKSLVDRLLGRKDNGHVSIQSYNQTH
jgi:hypothetical protein